MPKLRPMQADVLAYESGRMGVSAVPGSGKTFTLSLLAGKLIAEEFIKEDQEVLIVTLVNSAVNNFGQRISAFIQEQGLLPDFGYRVRTLHGLAHDIVRERPSLVGLSDKFLIADEKEIEEILRGASQAWLKAHPEFVDQFINEESGILRSPTGQRKILDLVISISSAFIRQAKDLQVTPQVLRQKLETLHGQFPLLELGLDVYAAYQTSLNYRSAVDFDDLIRLALDAITLDEDFLARLHYRWPYILEDEAQDSSRLQESILRKLAGPDGNWVRVGDPNQAIYETFTTASPEYLRHFLLRPDVIARSLANSGRSTLSIIKLANFLIDWTRDRHPILELREALSLPHIEPTPPNDPQPNPIDDSTKIFFVAKKYEPDQEIRTVVQSLQRWLPDHPEDTIAVLTPRNERGADLVEALKKAGIEYIELLRSSLPTREVAQVLATLLRYLADPTSAVRLSELFKKINETRSKDPASIDLVKKEIHLLRGCTHLEDFFHPAPGQDWIENLKPEDAPDPIPTDLQSFRDLVLRWQAATLLPVDQLVLSVAQDLYTNPADLALAHKLALLLERLAGTHPDWHLPEFSEELQDVASNRRKFTGFSEEDTGFDPDQHKGKVVVATIHKAKGLEWDRVYLLSVNNYDFPSAQGQDQFISEKYFVNDRLNLEAETLAQLKALFEQDPSRLYLAPGIATQAARLDYASERLRLLYVGLTRARKELVVTWNNGRNQDCVPAQPLVALMNFWEQQNGPTQ